MSTSRVCPVSSASQTATRCWWVWAAAAGSHSPPWPCPSRSTSCSRCVAAANALHVSVARPCRPTARAGRNLQVLQPERVAGRYQDRAAHGWSGRQEHRVPVFGHPNRVGDVRGGHQQPAEQWRSAQPVGSGREGAVAVGAPGDVPPRVCVTAPVCWPRRRPSWRTCRRPRRPRAWG